MEQVLPVIALWFGLALFALEAGRVEGAARCVTDCHAVLPVTCAQQLGV